MKTKLLILFLFLTTLCHADTYGVLYKTDQEANNNSGSDHHCLFHIRAIDSKNKVYEMGSKRELDGTIELKVRDDFVYLSPVNCGEKI